MANLDMDDVKKLSDLIMAGVNSKIEDINKNIVDIKSDLKGLRKETKDDLSELSKKVDDKFILVEHFADLANRNAHTQVKECQEAEEKKIELLFESHEITVMEKVRSEIKEVIPEITKEVSKALSKVKTIVKQNIPVIVGLAVMLFAGGASFTNSDRRIEYAEKEIVKNSIEQRQIVDELKLLKGSKP